MGGRGAASAVMKAVPMLSSGGYTNGAPIDDGDVDSMFDKAVAEGRIRFEDEGRKTDRALENDKFAIVALLNAGRNVVLLMRETGEGKHVDAMVDGVLYEIKSPTSDAYKKNKPSKVVTDNLDGARHQFRDDPRAAGASTRVVFNGKHTTLSDDDISSAIDDYMKKGMSNQAVEIIQINKDGTLRVHK